MRSVAYGGAPAPPDLVRRIKEHFPVGAPSNGYGLTETSSVTTMNSGRRLRAQARQRRTRRPGVRRAPSYPTASRAPSRPPTFPAGPEVTGELWIKGPNVVRGYWNKPEATAAHVHRRVAPLR